MKITLPGLYLLLLVLMTLVEFGLLFSYVSLYVFMAVVISSFVKFTCLLAILYLMRVDDGVPKDQ